MKLDVIAFAAHPDDVELSCSGTILSLIDQGKKVGVVDLTRGELGTRGNAELRDQEAKKSSQILGLSVRENLGFRDGFFQNDEDHQLAVIKIIRTYQPDIIFSNTPMDRHPDHVRANQLIKEATFLSGLRKIEVNGLEAWRPRLNYQYIQSDDIEPDVVVDITPYYSRKIESIRAFQSQFYNPDSKEPESFISSKRFWEFIEARNRNTGSKILVEFGEGFLLDTPIGVKDISLLI